MLCRKGSSIYANCSCRITRVSRNTVNTRWCHSEKNLGTREASSSAWPRGGGLLNRSGDAAITDRGSRAAICTMRDTTATEALGVSIQDHDVSKEQKAVESGRTFS